MHVCVLASQQPKFSALPSTGPLARHARRVQRCLVIGPYVTWQCGDLSCDQYMLMMLQVAYSYIIMGPIYRCHKLRPMPRLTKTATATNINRPRQ